MHFGAFRTDQERLTSALKSVEYVDNKPLPKPVHQSWNLRPRDHALEIGPQFRTNAHLQVQRVMDKLTYETNRYFEQHEIQHDPKGFGNKKAVEQYVKTGEYDFVAGLRRDQYESFTDLK